MRGFRLFQSKTIGKTKEEEKIASVNVCTYAHTHAYSHSPNKHRDEDNQK